MAKDRKAEAKTALAWDVWETYVIGRIYLLVNEGFNRETDIVEEAHLETLIIEAHGLRAEIPASKIPEEAREALLQMAGY